MEAAHLYKRLGRIRQTLLDCIRQTAGEEGSEQP